VKVVLVVQARMGSSRLPGKVMLQAAGRPLLWHQLERLRRVKNAQQVVVATSVAQEDDVIAAFCAAEGVAVVRGSQNDVLSRYVLAADSTAADAVVRLTADCPLIDPEIIDAVIATYLASPALHRYVSNTAQRTYPRGMDVEVFSRAMLDEAHRKAVTQYDREHVTPFIIRVVAGPVHIGNVAAPRSLAQYRLTVDYQSDYDNIRTLLESGLPDFSLATLMQRADALGLDLSEADWQRDHINIRGRIGLGAAQFGMRYGRFNVHGQPSDDALGTILDAASKFGLTLIDTAHLYGESEAALGRCGPGLHSFEVVTKTPRFADGPISAHDAGKLTAAFDASLQHLGLPAVHGLLVHHAPNLLAPGGERLYEAMLELKRQGRVANIGVSVYDGEIAEEIIARFPIDIVQLPMNVLDQRPLTSGVLSRLVNAGVKVQVRSAFLQGLLLADPAKLGPYFAPARAALEQFHAAARAAGVSPANAALHFLLGLGEIDRVIVGVESRAQLEQLFGSFPAAPAIDYSQFRIDVPDILNPALWPKLEP
jgi:spore coat polysaccharide biosynthesis protein SpsF (cytidylyltransferase family)/aryl-alcohol dehydrogenase-like predicted oxidoreductase